MNVCGSYWASAIRQEDGDGDSENNNAVAHKLCDSRPADGLPLQVNRGLLIFKRVFIRVRCMRSGNHEFLAEASVPVRLPWLPSSYEVFIDAIKILFVQYLHDFTSAPCGA